MIVVTRLNGPKFAVNPDLLQRIESTPDTILTLIDGTKYIVAESMEEITALVVEYRARVVASTIALTGEGYGDTTVAAVTQLRPQTGRAPLAAVPEPAEPADDSAAASDVTRSAANSGPSTAASAPTTPSPEVD